MLTEHENLLSEVIEKQDNSGEIVVYNQIQNDHKHCAISEKIQRAP